MDFQIWQSKLMRLWEQRNRYVVLAAVLFFINSIQTLTIFCLAGNWYTVIVPPTVSQALWVNQSSVSNEYLAAMTEYFATLVLDVTPDNAAFQRDTLLKYVDAEGYGALKTQLIANEDHIKAQSISTSFYPVDIKTDENKLSAVITGDVKTFAGQELTSTLRQSFVAHYHYRHGRLLLQHFSEVKKDDAKP